jgi:hypothetical protein
MGRIIAAAFTVTLYFTHEDKEILAITVPISNTLTKDVQILIGGSELSFSIIEFNS